MILVSGSFDSLHARQMRFLEEASRLGAVHLLLWSDALARAAGGQAPVFPQEERRYLLELVRYVSRVSLLDEPIDKDWQDWQGEEKPAAWVTQGEDEDEFAGVRAWCAAQGVPVRIIPSAGLEHFPPAPEMDCERRAGRKKVVVTGCYDWLHSGHVRFFEEASAFGELYVIVGNDANVRNLKGEGHPLFTQDLRRYMAGSIRFVHQALITSGWDWMDAEPEIERLQPDIYLVNEDGDKPEKREFCAQHGLEYVVLKRLPKPGLQRRTSTDLRGF